MSDPLTRMGLTCGDARQRPGSAEASNAGDPGGLRAGRREQLCVARQSGAPPENTKQPGLVPPGCGHAKRSHGPAITGYIPGEYVTLPVSGVPGLKQIVYTPLACWLSIYGPCPCLQAFRARNAQFTGHTQARNQTRSAFLEMERVSRPARPDADPPGRSGNRSA